MLRAASSARMPTSRIGAPAPVPVHADCVQGLRQQLPHETGLEDGGVEDDEAERAGRGEERVRGEIGPQAPPSTFRSSTGTSAHLRPCGAAEEGQAALASRPCLREGREARQQAKPRDGTSIHPPHQPKALSKQAAHEPLTSSAATSALRKYTTTSRGVFRSCQRHRSGRSSEDTSSGRMTPLQRGGTKYTATAIHRDEAGAKAHAEMGFKEGWGAALDQLVALAKTL